jgi:hypothetical protein
LHKPQLSIRLHKSPGRIAVLFAKENDQLVNHFVDRRRVTQFLPILSVTQRSAKQQIVERYFRVVVFFAFLALLYSRRRQHLRCLVFLIRAAAAAAATAALHHVLC